MPNILGNCGLIFGFENYDDNKDNYYLFIINNEGFISLKKRNKNKLENIFPLNDLIHNNYNKENIYKMNIKYNYNSNVIMTLLNDIEIFKISDISFKNSEIGFMSSDNGTTFTQLLLE